MIEKNIRLQPHHARDLLVGRRSDGKRPKYQPPSLGGGHANVGGGGGSGEYAGRHPPVYVAPTPRPAPDRQDRARQQAAVERAAEVKQQEAQAIAEYAEREASRISESERMNKLAEARKLMTQPTAVANPLARTPIPLGTVDPYQQSYVYPDKIWTDPRSVYESPDVPVTTGEGMIPGPIKGVIDVPKIKEIVNLGDDAKAQHIQTIQQQAVVDWTNKTEREKDEHREKLQAAQEKLKTTKGGGFWKSLGNIALAMVLPALLPAKLAKGYNLYKTASNASAWAKRLNLTDRNIMQIVQQDIFKGVDIQKAIAGKETEFAKAAAKFSGQTDSNKEYTEDTIGKVKTARDIGDTITNEERQKYISQLDYVQGILQSGYYTDNEGRRYELTDDKRRQLSDYMNHLNTYLNPTTQGIAHGGLIDQPLTGRSRYI